MCTKRSDHAPKNESVGFFNICPKRVVLGFFFFSYLTFSPSFLVTTVTFGKKINLKKKTFLYHGPLTFAAQEYLLLLSPAKPVGP